LDGAAHPGFTLSPDGLTLTTCSPAAGHALTVTLPDGAHGSADGRGADLSRVDVVVESGWRDTLEVQLLLSQPAAAAGGLRAFVPVRLLLPASGPEAVGVGTPLLRAAASAADSSVDIGVTAETLRLLPRVGGLAVAAAAASGLGGAPPGCPSPPSPPPPPQARLLLRTPQQLDVVVVTAGRAVACDVALCGKLETAALDVAAPRGSIVADRLRGTRVALAAGGGGVTVRSLLEVGSASVVVCGGSSGGGGFTAAKLLGDTVRVHAASGGRVSIAAAYVRQLTVEATGAVAAAAPPAAAPQPPAAISLSTLHGTAALRADDGDIAVRGLTGGITARAERGSVALHVDSARGASTVHCSGHATVTLLASPGGSGADELHHQHLHHPHVSATAPRVVLPSPAPAAATPPPPLGVSRGAGGAGAGGGSGKIASTGAAVTGFYFGSGSGSAGGDAAVSALGVGGTAAPPADAWVAALQASPAAVTQRWRAPSPAVAVGAAPSLHIVAGHAATVTLVDWQSLVRSRMATAAAARAPAAAAAVAR
jgi:hypothetical protein